MASGETPASRSELGYLDRDEWDHDESNRPVDPWQAVFEIPLREVDGKWREVTLAGGSRGMETAIRDLLGSYLAVVDQKAPALVPVITLEVEKYQHQHYGPIKVPSFPITDWLDPETKTLVKGNGKAPATKVKAKAAQAELDSELPF